MTINFPLLELWQQDVWADIENARGTGKMFIVKAKRQIGKTLLACIALVVYSIKNKGCSCVVEPTLSQSRRVFKQIYDMLSSTGLITKANESLLVMTFVNGSEILFKSAEQKESLRGMTISNILVIDEAAFISGDIIEILFPTVDAHLAPILMISTPLFKDSKFYELYCDGLRGINNCISYDWSKYDTSKYLPIEKLEQYRKTVSQQKFKSEYLGEFLDDGSYIFGDISKCFQPLSVHQPKFAGIDWGTGHGDDDTVVTLIDEYGYVVRIDAFRNMDALEQIKRISNIINSYPSLEKVQVELNSIGKVFYDMLVAAISKKSIIIGFNTTNESKRRIIEQLIEAFQKQTIGIPNDPQLIMELQHYAMEKAGNGYTYNGADNVHDDYCISLALAYDLIKNYHGSFGTFSFV